MKIKREGKEWLLRKEELMEAYNEVRRDIDNLIKENPLISKLVESGSIARGDMKLVDLLNVLRQDTVVSIVVDGEIVEKCLAYQLMSRFTSNKEIKEIIPTGELQLEVILQGRKNGGIKT